MHIKIKKLEEAILLILKGRAKDLFVVLTQRLVCDTYVQWKELSIISSTLSAVL